MRRLIGIVLIAALCVPVFADAKKAKDLVKKAEIEFDRRNIPGAEKLLRKAAEEDPDNLDAHRELADLLAMTNRYSQSVPEYRKTLEIDDQQKALTREQRRSIVDSLGVSTARSGDLKQARDWYLEALRKDPDYSFYNYNLACVYAELGDLDSAIPYLKKAWEKRDTMPSGMSFPDPRQDDSFKNFVNDPQFQDAVRNMVL